MWNCTHFRHPTDEQLRHVDIYFLATKMICSLSTLHYIKSGVEKDVLHLVEDLDRVMAKYKTTY